MKLKITYDFENKTIAVLPCVLVTINNGFGILLMIFNLVITIEIK